MGSVNFSVDPMYITVFCIVRWIENYHKEVKEKYSQDVVYVPDQRMNGVRGIAFSSSESRENAIENMMDAMETIEYTELLEWELMRDIPNHKARSFADYEYLSRYNLYLERYDKDKAMELISIYAEKYNLEVVDFDDYDLIGKTIWEHIHSIQDWKDIYMEMLSKGHGDTGMGVYSKSLKHFIPCKFAEHRGAIYSMLRMFDEFKDVKDFEMWTLSFRPTEENKEMMKRMNDLVMNDFILVGNSYKNPTQYTGYKEEL